MKIEKTPYGSRFQNEVREIEITDPEVEDFFFKLVEINDQGKKESLLFTKHKEILENITQYTQEQILQYASVLLKFSPSSAFLAGRIMKEWSKQDEESALVSGTIQSGVSDDVTGII